MFYLWKCLDEFPTLHRRVHSLPIIGGGVTLETEGQAHHTGILYAHEPAREGAGRGDVKFHSQELHPFPPNPPFNCMSRR